MRIALHRVGNPSPRRPTFPSGERTALAPLSDTGLTIMPETHHPGGEKTDLSSVPNPIQK